MDGLIEHAPIIGLWFDKFNGNSLIGQSGHALRKKKASRSWL